MAHFGKSLIWHGGNIGFAFYLTEICAQSPATMAALLAVSSIVNVIADGVIGTASTTRMTDGATASRCQFGGSVAAGLAFAAFCAAGLVPPSIRLGYALCTLFAFRIAYATVDVPQNALLAYIPADSDTQERLLAARMMTGYAAQVATAVLISALLLATSPAAALYCALGGTAVGTLAILSALAFRLHAVRTPLSTRPWKPATAAAPIGTAVRRSSFLELLLACAVFAFVSSFVIRLQAYIAAYGSGPGLGAASMMIVPVAMAVGGLIGQPFWAMLCRRRGVHATVRIASIALIGTALLFCAAAASHSVWAALATALLGAALGGTSFALWALLARCARDGNAALRFGVFTCTSKLAHALSAVALGVMLSQGDYRSPLATTGMDFWPLSAVVAIGMGAVLLLLDVRPPRFRKDSSV